MGRRMRRAHRACAAPPGRGCLCRLLPAQLAADMLRTPPCLLRVQTTRTERRGDRAAAYRCSCGIAAATLPSFSCTPSFILRSTIRPYCPSPAPSQQCNRTARRAAASCCARHLRPGRLWWQPTRNHTPAQHRPGALPHRPAASGLPSQSSPYLGAAVNAISPRQELGIRLGLTHGTAAQRAAAAMTSDQLTLVRDLQSACTSLRCSAASFQPPTDPPPPARQHPNTAGPPPTAQ